MLACCSLPVASWVYWRVSEIVSLCICRAMLRSAIATSKKWLAQHVTCTI